MEPNDYVGWIVTLFFLLMYVFSMGAKKKPPQRREPEEPSYYEVEVKRPPPRRPPPVIAPRQEKKEVQTSMSSSYVAAHSDIESLHSHAYDQKFTGEASFASAIEKGLSHQIDLDPAYQIGKEKKVSLVRAILAKNRSLKDLIVIQEVLKRPYE